MIQLDAKKKCCGCYACCQKCPVKAIHMEIDTEGFVYPVTDRSLCVNCHLCEKVCPIINTRQETDEPEVYACHRTSLDKRLKSASGGIFAVFAEAIFERGGCVFGAAFDENWNLQHRVAWDETELEGLLGSKYLQSDLGSTFFQVREALTSGLPVLFSGTPCQVQGLQNYLGKAYSNLFTVDLVCHGVSSPGVWKDYLNEISDGKTIKSFIPRDKTKGITEAPLVFEFCDGSVLKENYSKNTFIRGFSNNLYLRPSCYECKFKGIKRCSDVTLGDFWGFEKYYPEFGDQFGVSCVLLHTEKGKKLYSMIQNQVCAISADVVQILPCNPCLIKPIGKTEKRQKFFDYRLNHSMIDSVSLTLKPSMFERFQHLLHEGKCYCSVVRRKIKKYLERK